MRIRWYARQNCRLQIRANFIPAKPFEYYVRSSTGVKNRSAPLQSKTKLMWKVGTQTSVNFLTFTEKTSKLKLFFSEKVIGQNFTYIVAVSSSYQGTCKNRRWLLNSSMFLYLHISKKYFFTFISSNTRNSNPF
jgi:hypothetical protein